MDDEEFDQVAKILFDGVSSIEKSGIPGILIPLSKNTRAVLCGDDSTNVIIVAARFGEGRCLIFGHTSYLNYFTQPDDYKDSEKFINNCKQWVSKGTSNEVLNIDDVNAMADIETKDKILVWDGHYEKDTEFMNDLCEFLQAGGGIICGSTAWGWLQRHGEKEISNFPFTYFCNNLGVKLTNSTSSCPNPIPFQSELIQFKNLQQAVEDLNENPDATGLYSVVGAAIKEMGGILPEELTKILEKLISNITQDVIPDHDSPIEDADRREQAQSLCDIMYLLPGIKAPGVAVFPGDFTDQPELECDALYTIESKYEEWFCTGYYVAAGTTIQIDIVEQQGTTGWSARIGCHSDDIKYSNEYRRWNSISIVKTLTNESTEISSAFGGLLFLQSPDENVNSITVNIHRVVLTPTYQLKDSDRVETWQYQQEHAQGLWADISGNYIVFNLPSTSVKHLDSAYLDKVLEFWDSVILAQHDLVGTQPKHRERIVCDEQPTIGYMHSGYPIVTHMDISDSKSKDFIFNLDKLEKEGAWGLFHELGHNRQHSSWTFEGTREVTTNIFTLYTMDIVCHQKIWIHPWLNGHLDNAKNYISNGSKFDEWKEKPGVALFIYTQLAREYGWDSYKEVFRKYAELNPKLETDEDKIDYWIEIFSRQVKQNLIPLFKFWGFPVSQSTIEKLSDLEIPKITDELIELAPERYTIE